MEMSRAVDGKKKCPKCGKVKPAMGEYYGLNIRALDGLQPYCMECMRAYHREWRKAFRKERTAHYEAYKKEKNVYDRKRYDINKEAGICVQHGCNNPSIYGQTRCETHRWGEDSPHYEHGGRSVDNLLEREVLEILHGANIPYHLYPYGRRLSPDAAVWNPKKAIRALIEAGFVVWKGPENGGKAVYVEFKGHPRAFHNIPNAVKKTVGEILLVSRRGSEEKRLKKWIDKHPKLGFMELERS